jgi:PAS domain S-box-containing protein
MTLPPEPTRAHEALLDLEPPRGELAFRLLIEAVEDYAIFLLSPAGIVLTWNTGAERIKGYAAEEIIGQHFSVFYTEEDRAADRPTQLLGKARRYGRFEVEGWRVRKDGTRFWADVILTALRNDQGETYAFAKITRDLTERRAAEQQQRELLGEQRARAAAEEALAARDRFLSIAAHELKTPVASLRLSAEGLLHARAAGRLDDARLATALDRITTASQRLGALVDELLDITRLEAEVMPLTRVPTDLVALAREVIDRFEESAHAGRIHLEAPDTLELAVDAGRIDQVLTNLVDNALKYSPDGSGVEVALTEAGEEVLIEVGDRGIGLDDSAGQRLFEAFGRGENAEHVAGLGLGLHIAREIVLHHGGRIEPIDREDGPGTIFRVILPRPKDGAA